MLPAIARPFIKLCAFAALMAAFFSCNNNKKFYKSSCDDDKTFKNISMTQLVDSLKYYDNKYVQVSGTYKQDKDESGLFNDSLYIDDDGKALWVEFSPDCPLYLWGTRIGFFDYDYNNGKLTPANNKKVILRGIINIHNKGYMGAYSGSIEHISYIKL